MDASHLLMVDGCGMRWTPAGGRHQCAQWGRRWVFPGKPGGSEMKAIRTVVGVDTAKLVFQLHWVELETGHQL